MRKPGRPVFTTVLAIIQLVAGGSLLACGGFGLVVSAAGEHSATVTIRTGGQETTRVYDPREEMERETPGYKVILFSGKTADVVLNVVLLAGAIGLLAVRGWGWWLSVAWAVLAAGFQVAAACYLWLVAMPACNRVVKVVPHDVDGTCGSLANGNTLYHLTWALFASALTLYPLVMLVLLVLPPVWRPLLCRDEANEDGTDEGERRERSRDDRRGERERSRRERDDY